MARAGELAVLRRPERLRHLGVQRAALPPARGRGLAMHAVWSGRVSGAAQCDGEVGLPGQATDGGATGDARGRQGVEALPAGPGDTWRAWWAGRSPHPTWVDPQEQARRTGARTGLNALEALRWQNHWRIEAAGREMCLRCGLGPRKVTKAKMGDASCSGHRPLVGAALIALRYGAFKEALADVPAEWRAKAHQSGA